MRGAGLVRRLRHVQGNGCADRLVPRAVPGRRRRRVAAQFSGAGPARACRTAPCHAKIRATTAGAQEMNPSILVIDDNPDHLELTVMALGECCDPRDVVTCSDGVEALDYLFGRGEPAARDALLQPRL